jgi:hypothetical protein
LIEEKEWKDEAKRWTVPPLAHGSQNQGLLLA